MNAVQRTLQLRGYPRGFHLVTGEIVKNLPEIKHTGIGILNLLIQHTSASLTLNENADPTVREDMEAHFNQMVPEDATHYRHTLEGLDDCTSHIKTSILGASLAIPVTAGKLNLGTWQGIYLCEHRNRSHGRKILATLMGTSL